MNHGAIAIAIEKEKERERESIRRLSLRNVKIVGNEERQRARFSCDKNRSKVKRIDGHIYKQPYQLSVNIFAN